MVRQPLEAEPPTTSTAADDAPLPDDGRLLDSNSALRCLITPRGIFSPDTPAPGYAVSNMYSDRRLPRQGILTKASSSRPRTRNLALQFHLESQVDARIWSSARPGPGQ